MTFPTARRHRVLVVCALLLPAGLVGCQTDNTVTGSVGGPFAQAPPPMQRHEAAMYCWAEVDKSLPKAGVDQRAEFVTGCIDKKMKVSVEQPAAPAAAKPKS
jgi:hypothetical protein